jgi:TctA family transporter
LSLRSDDLNSVGELYTDDEFRQQVVTIETAPVFLGRLSELEDHGERNLLLTSFVLGPWLEENLHRSMLLERGDVWAIINRPIVALLLAAGVALVLAAGLCKWQQPARRTG